MLLSCSVAFIPIQLSLVLMHLSGCLGSTYMVYSDYVKQRILFLGSAGARGHPLAPAWLSVALWLLFPVFSFWLSLILTLSLTAILF